MSAPAARIRCDPASNAEAPCDKRAKTPQRRAKMASFTERMLGAAKLDARTYEEVEADTNAMGQALGVVVISSIAAGIGSFGFGGISGVIWGCVAALVGWVVWAFLIWVIGTKMLPEPQTKSDVPELLRTTGFASTPGILRILGVLPFIGVVISFLAGLWMLAAMVIAVRQALDYQSTARAIGVCIIGFIVNLILVWLLLPRATLTGGFGI
jgi:hypothetical protein